MRVRRDNADGGRGRRKEGGTRREPETVTESQSQSKSQVRCGAAETRTNGLQGTHRRMGDLADTARSAWYNRAKTSSRYPCATPRARPSGPRPAEHLRTRPSSFRNNGTKQGNGTPKSKHCPTMPNVHVRRAFFLTASKQDVILETCPCSGLSAPWVRGLA